MKPKLLCVPYAGGTAKAFQNVQKYLTTEWDMIAIDPPGHGANRDPLLDDLEALVAYYLEKLQPHFSGRFALFGHSMGGKIVHRMAQELEESGRIPEATIVSAMYPPDIKRPGAAHLERDAFLAYMKSLGGIPDVLFQHDDLLDFYIPIFRADLRAVEEHVCPNTRTLTSPLFVFRGAADERATPDVIAGWSRWAEQVEFTVFDGGHMFLLHQAEQVGAKVSSLLVNTTIRT